MDADGATPPRAFHELVTHIGGVDCVIGSRWLPGAVLHVEQSGQRRFASRAFHLIVQFLFRMNLRDTQCGAKVMRREAVEKVHSSLRIADMAFDINLLYSLKRAGYRIRRSPDRMDGQDRLQGHAVRDLAGDVPLGGADSAHLLAAALPIAAPAPPARRLGLPQTARAPSHARGRWRAVNSPKSVSLGSCCLGGTRIAGLLLGQPLGKSAPSTRRNHFERASVSTRGRVVLCGARWAP